MPHHWHLVALHLLRGVASRSRRVAALLWGVATLLGVAALLRVAVSLLWGVAARSRVSLLWGVATLVACRVNNVAKDHHQFVSILSAFDLLTCVIRHACPLDTTHT